MAWHVTADEGFAALPREPDGTYPEGVPFRVVMGHGGMRVEAFAPSVEDRQGPHEQDELYVVLSGSSAFVRGAERITCGPGDVILVPAGLEHRFVDFSPDFRTWVVFWGPPGGDAA